MDGWMDGWMGWMDGWMDGMDGWMGWMDGWMSMSVCMKICVLPIIKS